MQVTRRQKVALVVLVLIVVSVVLFRVLVRKEHTQVEIPVVQEPLVEIPVEVPISDRVVIGTSVEGREIDVYTYGSGPTKILFVGGIHGGYEWNSVLLAYQFIDYIKENPSNIPEGVSLSIIPSANPDGVYAVIGKEGRFALSDIPKATGAEGAGRFNAHAVDLNRNFDCKWKPESKWRGKTVSAGTEAFSEPEAQALRDFVLAEKPALAVFWHSQSNAVYASECTAGILPLTRTFMNLYAKNAGYPAVDTFDAYEITGDAEGWLASIGVPAITVELKTHETIEWEKNLFGINAILAHFKTSL